MRNANEPLVSDSRLYFPTGGVSNPFQLVPGPVKPDDSRFRSSYPPLSSFFFCHYYRCRFFPRICGANIPSWRPSSRPNRYQLSHSYFFGKQRAERDPISSLFRDFAETYACRFLYVS